MLPTPGSEPVGERPPVAADAATERPGDEARPAEVEATDSEANGTAPSTVTNGAAEPDPGANGTVPSAGMGGAVEPDPGANGTVSSSGAQEAAEADFRANGTVPSAGTAGVAEPDPGADGTVSCAEKGGAAEPDPDDAAGGSEQSGRSEPVRGAEPDGGVVSEADREMVDVAADVTMDGERDVMNEAGGTEARIGEEGGEGWEQRAVPETEESKEELDLMFAEGDTIFGPSVGLEIGGGEEEVAGRSENGAELGRESGAAGIEEASGTQKEAGADFEFGSNDDGAGVSTAEGVGKSDASGEEPGCDQLRLRVGLRSFVGDQDGVPQQAMDADRDGSVAGTGGADPEQRPEQENTQIGMAEPDPDDPSDQVTVLQQEAGGDAIALVAEVGGNEKLPGQNISRAERVPEPLGLEGEGDQLTNLQRAGSGEGQLVVAGAGGPAEAGGHLAEAEPDADDSEADPQGDQPHALQSAAEGDGQIVVAGGAPGHATWQPEEGSLWAAYGKQLLPGGFLWGAYADELPSDIAQTSANWAPAENARNTENRRAAEKSQWASERPPVCANCGFCKEGPAVGPGGPLGRMGMPPWGGAEPWAAVPVSVLREWILGGGAEVSSKTQPALGSGGPLQALEAPPGAGKKRGRQSPGIATMEPLQIGGTSAGEVAGLPQRDSSCGGSLKRFRPGSQAPGGARAAGDDVSDGALRGGASAAVTGGRVASLGDAEVG